MKIPSLFEAVNINLIVPVFIVFALMRIKAVYNVALRLISGLKFFTQRRYATISKTPKENPTPGDVIEQSIAKLNLTMIELDDSMPTKYVLRTQLFYDMFEAMVNLALGCILAYAWSMGFHCVNPAAESSCWVVLLMLALALFSYQCLIQILVMTGWRAKETKFAIIIGFAMFLVSMAQFLSNNAYINNATVTAIAVHINALLLQISPQTTAINLNALVPLVEIALSGTFALVVAGLVIPALRYSQALDTMIFGARSALTSGTDRALLWADFFLPLAVGIAFSPVPALMYQQIFPLAGKTCTGTEPGTCSSTDATAFTAGANVLTTVQLVLCAAMLVLRIACMKKHLQCFLDTIVRLVSAHLMATGAGQTVDQPMLLARIKAVTDYLMTAATQYLAVPLFAVACVLLMHRSSAVGTGLCQAAYQALGADQTPLLSSISTAAAFNTSALAIESAKAPFLSTIFHAAAGAQMTGANLSGTTPTAALAAFALKMSNIYALPAAVAVTLCKAFVCMHSLVWFALNLAGLIAWRYHPGIIVGGQ